MTIFLNSLKCMVLIFNELNPLLDNFKIKMFELFFKLMPFFVHLKTVNELPLKRLLQLVKLNKVIWLLIFISFTSLKFMSISRKLRAIPPLF